MDGSGVRTAIIQGHRLRFRIKADTSPDGIVILEAHLAGLLREAPLCWIETCPPLRRIRLIQIATSLRSRYMRRRSRLVLVEEGVRYWLGHRRLRWVQGEYPIRQLIDVGTQLSKLILYCRHFSGYLQIEVCEHVRREDAVDLLLQALLNRELIPRELLLQVRVVPHHLLKADLAYLILRVLDLLRNLLCLPPHHLQLHKDHVHFLEYFCE